MSIILLSFQQVKESSTKTRIQGLDLLRISAIVAVFFFHYSLTVDTGWIKSIGQFGWIGVDLFFVLSGFLIGRQLFSEIKKTGEISLGRFYMRRAFRILPSFWVVLAAYFFIPGFADRPHIAPAWKFLTFTLNFGLDHSKTRVFSHAWSLCIEEQFYLLFPILSLLLLRKSVFFRQCEMRKIAGIAFSLFVAGIGLRTFSWSHFMQPLLRNHHFNESSNMFLEYVYFPTYNRLDGLTAGVFLAGLAVFRPEVWQALQNRWAILLGSGSALLLICLWIVRNRYSLPSAALGYPLLAISFGCFAVAASADKSPLNRYRMPGAETAAALAYASYLTHIQVIHFVSLITKGWGLSGKGITPFILSALGSIGVACVLHYGIERPFVRLGSKLASKFFTRRPVSGLCGY